MNLPRTYSESMLAQMKAVYDRAFRVLRLDCEAESERERLATCVLSLGNTEKTFELQFVDAVRLYDAGYHLDADPVHAQRMVAATISPA